MPKILVSLFSHQMLPNVLIIKEPFFEKIEEYLFISTPWMEERGSFQHLLLATNIDAKKCHKIIVQENDLGDMHRQLTKFCNNRNNDEFWINLTCGTKMMTLGVHDFFIQPVYNSHLFYVPFGKKTWQRIYPQKNTVEQLIHYQIGIEKYLNTSGISIDNAQLVNHFNQHPDCANRLLKTYLESSQLLTSRQLPLRQLMLELKQLERRGGAYVNIESDDWVIELIAILGMQQKEKGRLYKAEIQYLRGGWLEELLYHEIKAQFQLPDNAIGNNIVIQRKNSRGAVVLNEFDVLFTHQNALHVIECKTGLGKNRQQIKTSFNNTIYKLTALKTEFGLDVHGWFFTLENLRDKKSGEITEKLWDRANVHRIQIIDKIDFENGIEAVFEKIIRN